MLKFSLLLMSLFSISTVAEASEMHVLKKKRHIQVLKTEPLKGIASFYGPGVWGHKTSSGKILKKNDMTAAHKSFPLGTKLEVINRDNGKSVIVTINDRGPFVKKRIIDLAEKPAKLLDMKESGVAHVELVVLNKPEKDIMEVASYVEKPKQKYHMNKKILTK